MRMDDQDTQVWMTKEEAAAHLRVSQRTLDRRVAAGELPSYQLGPQAVRFRRADLDALPQERNPKPLRVG